MILEVNDVSKVFISRKAKTVANDNLSFSIQEGEIFGLLGHNGAGKTTLVKQILGLLIPSSGDINLLGKSVIQSPTWARSVCAMQPQSQVPLGFLTPRQAVSMMGKMRSGKNFNPKRMEMLFEALDMGEWLDTEGQKLSGGVKRLTAFCMTAISPSNLIILDEPTNDVDPVRRHYLWQVIRDLTRDGTSVILVTHNVVEAEKAVDRLAILHKGKFIEQGTPSQIKSSVNNLVRFEISMLDHKVKLKTPEWAISTNHSGSKLSFSLEPSNVLRTINWFEDQMNSGKVLNYTLQPTTIEDVYIELTSEKEIIR
ncbi:ABC transporter ATP-binding protein [Amphibacillus jilinensis]|uniref:ABC transporter ATP-binding protein n=1 Tax=Amphibacillus jilinensis TaxID=1216008 RepID=UPI000310CEA7|nr:ABC transporter ATP-binding protein [Amphibacillus jilinensis]